MLEYLVIGAESPGLHLLHRTLMRRMLGRTEGRMTGHSLNLRTRVRCAEGVAQYMVRHGQTAKNHRNVAARPAGTARSVVEF